MVAKNQTMEKLRRNTILSDCENIKINSENSTNEINGLISSSEKIIVVVDDKDTADYKNRIDMRDASIYNIIATKAFGDKMLMTITKFKTLFFLGYLDMSVDFIVFRVLVSCEIFSLLKEIYNRNLFDKLVLYLKPNTPVCQGEGFFRNVEDAEGIPDSKFEIIEIKPKSTAGFKRYLITKNILIHLDIKITADILLREAVSFELAFEEIKKSFLLKNMTFGNHLVLSTGDNELLIRSTKHQRLIELLGSLGDLKVYLVSKNPGVLKYSGLHTNVQTITAETNISKFMDISAHIKVEAGFNNAVLIFYDVLHLRIVSLKFMKTYIFKANTESFIDAIKIINLQKSGSECKYIKFLMKSEERFEPEGSNALVLQPMAFQMLSTFLYLLKFHLDENFLYVKNLKTESEFEAVGTAFVCRLILPPLHRSQVFTDVYVSKTCESRKEAQNSAAFQAFTALYDDGFMDKNFSPTRKFIEDNQIYNHYLKSVYGVCGWSRVFCFRKEYITNKINSLSIPREAAENIFRKQYWIELSYEFIRRPSIWIEPEPNDISNDLNIEEEPIYDLLGKGSTSVVLEKEDVESMKIFSRKVPSCLTQYHQNFSIYVIDEGSESDWDLGFCCGNSFKEEVHYKRTHLKYLRSIEFTLEELDLVFFFQVVFFCLHFDVNKYHVGDPIKYCYYVVPIRAGEIDFDFLKTFSAKFMGVSMIESINSALKSDAENSTNANISKLGDNLMYNPINKIFYLFSECVKDIKITEKLIPSKNGKDFCKFEEATSFISYYEYFQKKYNKNLFRRIDENNILIHGSIYPGQREMSILCAEVLYTTGVNKNLHMKYKKFKSIFCIVEFAMLTEELRVSASLEISLSGLMTCLTSISFVGNAGDQQQPNSQNGVFSYERYEFLGDAIIKYLTVTNLVYSDMNIQSAVNKKGDVVSNINLSIIARRLNIPNYCMHLISPEQLFQAPNLYSMLGLMDNLDRSSCYNGWKFDYIATYYQNFSEYIKYFKAEGKFHCTNIFERKAVESMQENKVVDKRYADILEAIIGMYFCEGGMKSAEKLFYKLKILKNHEVPVSFAAISKRILEAIDIQIVGDDLAGNLGKSIHKTGLSEFKLSLLEIYEIETKIGHVFSNKSLLSVALFHPSSSLTRCGAIFEILEFIGDAVVDLLVTIEIFKNDSLGTPFLLHEKRKSLVNNFSFGRMLFKMNMQSHGRTFFSDEHLDEIKEKLKFDGGVVNKAFGDIFEAVIGAVLVDIDFDLERFNPIFFRMYDNLLLCADETR